MSKKNILKTDIERAIKYNLNPRVKEINELVDNFIPNDFMKTLIATYKSELEDYDLIDSVELFSTLPLKGSLRYINKYDKQLRYGGLLIKIYQENGQWIGVIKKPNNKKYYVKYDLNHVFYLKNKNDNMRKFAELFITDIENGDYEIV
jgi:hypothetical protein